MPAKRNSKFTKKSANPYTRYFDAQKSLPLGHEHSKVGLYRRESVYVLSSGQKKRRNQKHIQLQPAGDKCGLPKWNSKVDHYMVVTEDHTHPQNQQQQQNEPPQLDAICYDVLKQPPMPVHLEGTDIVPSIRGVRLSICVENTRFGLISRISKNMGFQHVPEHRLWNVQWSDATPHHDLLKSMKRFQQINHFPGMMEICRKDLLSRNLNRMLKMYPGDYRIFPKTWLMPTDAYDVAIYASRHKRTYILKPYSAGQGRGIRLTNDLRTVGKQEKLICQTYIERPLLIDGYKFDLRVYTLITSVDPLRIFVYNEGLARFATHKYVAPTLGNSHNVFMHLTNYCLNRRNSQYDLGCDAEAGSKRKLSAFNKWLVEHNYDVAEFWATVDDAIIKTVVSAWPVLKHNYHACFPKHDKIQASFQLLGFDILVDWKLKPYILEVNHTPSLCADEQVDNEVKRPLIRDTLNLLSTALVDKEQIIREDRGTLRARLMKQVCNRKSTAQQATPQEAPQRVAGGQEGGQACSIGALAQQIAWEESHLGNYRRIMPPVDSEKVNYYCKFYDQTKQLVMFAETASSRRREKLTRMQMQKHKLTQELNIHQRDLKLPRKSAARPEISRLNPLWLAENQRRKEEAEAQALKQRALIAKEIQRQKELLLVPMCRAKERVGIWQSVRRQPRQPAAKASVKVKRSASLKIQRRKQQRLVSQRTRHKRLLELEAQRDAQFVEKHAIKQRVEGGRTLPSRSRSLSSRQKQQTGSEEGFQTPRNWSPEPISVAEQQEQHNWRQERGEQLDGFGFREMV